MNPMTPHTPVEGLVAKWRDDARENGSEDWPQTAMLLACADELEAALASLPVEGWISVKDRLPQYGQPIEGRNARGQTWGEEFDPGEPLGNMIEWRPQAVSARRKKHGSTAQDQRQGNEQGGTHE